MDKSRMTILAVPFYSYCVCVWIGSGPREGTHTNVAGRPTCDTPSIPPHIIFNSARTQLYITWYLAIINGHNTISKNKVFWAIDKEHLPPGTKSIYSMGAWKPKSNGKKCGKLNACGSKQVDGQSFDSGNTHVPVTNHVMTRLVLVMMILAGWLFHIANVKGAFLHGKFKKGEKVYMKVSEGWEWFYPTNAVIFLLRNIYGL